MTEKKELRLWQLLLLLFTLSAAAPSLPHDCITSYGLFGEVKSSVLTEAADTGASLISSRITVRESQKGIRVFNIWFNLWAAVVCLRFLQSVRKLPRSDTIVAKKVRMND